MFLVNYIDFRSQLQTELVSGVRVRQVAIDQGINIVSKCCCRENLSTVEGCLFNRGSVIQGLYCMSQKHKLSML